MTDAEIIARIKKGENEIYHELVSRYRGMVYGLALHRLNGSDEAHDIAQESFVRAFEHLDRLQQPDKFAEWLHRITLNRCHQWHRKQRESEPLTGDETFSTTVDIQDSRFAIQEALEALSPASRLTVILFYLHEYSLQEIADFLAVPVTTIKSRLRNARTRLRKELWEMAENTVQQNKPAANFAIETMRMLDASSILAVAFAPDGQTVATGNRDGLLKLWDAATGKLRQTCAAHHRPIDAVAFAPDRQTIATGSRDRTIKLWDATTGTVRYTLPNEGNADSIAFSPDGKLLAANSTLRTEFETHRRFTSKVALWDVATGRQVRELASLIHERHWTNAPAIAKEVGGSFYGVAFAPDGGEIATSNTMTDDKSGNYTQLRFWNREGTLLQTIKLDKPFVKSLTYSPDGRSLAFACLEATPRGPRHQEITGGEVCFWERRSGELSCRWRDELHGGVQNVAFSPDGALLATGYAHSCEGLVTANHIHLRDTESGKLIQVLTQDRKFHSAFAFSPDSKVLVVGYADNTLQFWQIT